MMVLIRDERTGKELTNGRVTLKLATPGEKEQVKDTNYKDTMKTYDAYFNLSETGRYQVTTRLKPVAEKGSGGVQRHYALPLRLMITI